MKSVNQSIKPTTAKINDKGHIELGGCDCVELAREYGTPLYVIDEQTLRTVAREYKEAFKDYPNVRMMYASKALMNKAIAKILSQEGFGFDVEANFTFEDIVSVFPKSSSENSLN